MKINSIVLVGILICFCGASYGSQQSPESLEENQATRRATFKSLDAEIKSSSQVPTTRDYIGFKEISIPSKTSSPQPSPSPTSPNSSSANSASRQSPTIQKKKVKSGRKSPIANHSIKKLKKFLAEQGYARANKTGSHDVYKNTSGKSVSLVYHNEGEVMFGGYLKSFADDIGWDVNELNDYLLGMKG